MLVSFVLCWRLFCVLNLWEDVSFYFLFVKFLLGRMPIVGEMAIYSCKNTVKIALTFKLWEPGSRYQYAVHYSTTIRYRSTVLYSTTSNTRRCAWSTRTRKHRTFQLGALLQCIEKGIRAWSFFRKRNESQKVFCVAKALGCPTKSVPARFRF